MNSIGEFLRPSLLGNSDGDVSMPSVMISPVVFESYSSSEFDDRNDRKYSVKQTGLGLISIMNSSENLQDDSKGEEEFESELNRIESGSFCSADYENAIQEVTEEFLILHYEVNKQAFDCRKSIDVRRVKDSFELCNFDSDEGKNALENEEFSRG
eukprot:CAMPEP_0182448696 /NCGR_PEP_ID=MMETSP1172-20130603/28897_1 /TAXON_ID=708627 /ORGANISM="Timspurckia oligopyrenoides, Strain CCMP3278" /LENGTH=154 /DNA_ID=CAMNT_0024645651 /DNA_START=437 /DNA_END=897 /DNA_ORIENTATION=-